MSATSIESTQQNIRSKLDHELYSIWCLGGGVLVAGCVALGLAWGRQEAVQWLLQAGLLWWLVLFPTRRRLELNRPHGDAPLYHALGWGNRLTLLRAWLIAAVAGFLFQRWPESPVMAWVPGVLYFLAAVIDRIDGYVARRTGQTSLLGGELDTVFDALGLAVASALVVWYGQAHWSYLLIGIAYYLFLGGISWRRKRELPVYPLPPVLHRRAWAGFQMGYLAVALWPLFYPPVTTLAGVAFMLPALLGFLVDWLIVSGRINRQAQGIAAFFNRLTDFSQAVLQPALRLAIVVLLLVLVGLPGFTLMSEPGTDWQSVMMTSGFILAVVLIMLGVAGRAASLMLIGLLGWYYSIYPPQPLDYLLFCSVVWLMLLGTGRFSLWQADERWLHRYDGT